jgi:hypothetical protein
VITTVIIFIPLLGATLMLLLPDDARTVRYGALGVAAVPLVLATYTYFAYSDNLEAAALSQSFTWIESLNVGYRVGLDGLGFGMFFLAALLTLIAVVASWDVQDNLKQYFAILFVAEVGMLGVFAAQDLILFYIFFEITLIPMYLLVGIWGDENRRGAAIKFFIYTFLGSTIMLAGFLAFGILAGSYSMGALNAGGGLSRGPDTLRSSGQGPGGAAARLAPRRLRLQPHLDERRALWGPAEAGYLRLDQDSGSTPSPGSRAVLAVPGGTRGREHNLRRVRGVPATGPQGAGGLLLDQLSWVHPPGGGVG